MHLVISEYHNVLVEHIVQHEQVAVQIVERENIVAHEQAAVVLQQLEIMQILRVVRQRVLVDIQVMHELLHKAIVILQ